MLNYFHSPPHLWKPMKHGDSNSILYFWLLAVKLGEDGYISVHAEVCISKLLKYENQVCVWAQYYDWSHKFLYGKLCKLQCENDIMCLDRKLCWCAVIIRSWNGCIILIMICIDQMEFLMMHKIGGVSVDQAYL